MATALKDARIHLSHPKLFREQNYIDGAWVDADSRKTIEVTDLAVFSSVSTCVVAVVTIAQRPSRRCSDS